MYVLPVDIKQENADSKHYSVKNKKVPRVSAIVDYAQKNNRKSLDSWIERVGHEEANKIRQNAAAIGRKVHKALEMTYKSPDNVAEFVAGMSDDACKIFSNYKSWRYYFKPLDVESKVYFSDAMTGHAFAGTYDAIGTFDRNIFRSKGCKIINFSSKVLVDYKNYAKQKNPRYLVKAFLQLAAYTLGYNQMAENEFSEDLINEALLVTASRRQVNMYHLNEEILDFFQLAFLKCLDAYYCQTDFNWDGLMKSVGFGWSEQFNGPVILEDNYIPERIYFIKEIK